MGILFVYNFIPYLELSCCKKRQKSPEQETSLRNRGCLKVLNDAKLFLNDSYSFRTNLVSFRTFRRPLFPKPFSCPGFFFVFSYSKTALLLELYLFCGWSYENRNSCAWHFAGFKCRTCESQLIHALKLNVIDLGNSPK